MSIRTILVASMLASLGAIIGQESAVFAQPVLPPPPAPMYQPEPEPEQAYPPPDPSYNPQQQPAQPYPPQQQPAQPYPPQQQPAQAYPPPQQPATGYPQPGQGYPPPQPQGYPPPQPQGYPPPQPQGYPPPQPQGYPPPQQDYPAPAQPAPKSESVFSNPLSKLQVGFHLATGSIDTPDDPVRASDFSSYGIFARYRFNQRWEAELGVASEGGTMESNKAKREFRPITASGLWHVFDIRGVDLYARFGLGRSTEVYDHPDYKALEFQATHIHLGAGASYIFRQNIGAGVEIRQQWINRAGSADSPEDLGGRGMTYSLVGSYHF
ncbi:MAG TPA: outer membrane beta-barrel protein [Haliangium sp.]|nr:outer membrane beta-barrel protein [Haliangium sp.]